MSGEIKYYSLTHPQKRIWYTEEVYPDTGFANNAFTAWFKGEVDCALLQTAINITIQKNDGMRLRLTEIDGDIKQYLVDYEEQKVNVFEFRGPNSILKLGEWVRQTTEKSFALIDSQLFYFAIVKHDAERSGFYFKIHHVLSDALSNALIINQVAEYYNALLAGEEINLEKRPSYIDYTLSEEEYKNSNRFKQSKEFWNDKFKNVTEPTGLKPLDVTHYGLQAKRKDFLVPDDLRQRINAFCEKFGVSVFGLFLAIVNIYLAKMTTKENITVGTSFYNRNTAKDKETVGMFASTVPVNVDIDNEMEFQAFVQVVSKELRGVMRHQKYPYDLLLEDLRSTHKNLNRLFDVLLVYQNSWGKVDVKLDWNFNGSITYPLEIHVDEIKESDQLQILLDYQTDIFTQDEIDEIYERIINLVSDAVSNPEKKLAYLKPISSTQIKQLLFDFNKTEVNYQSVKTLQALFEDQVNDTPDAVALTFKETKFTYRELNEKANQLARVLRDKGVACESIVGIMVERSPEMLIGIMAVLKAGGAYLPIDPEYPDDRINYMLEDSNAVLLLTEQDLVSKVNFKGEWIDLKDSSLYAGDGTNIDSINGPENLAYVIYTSGSTGKPKGVMLEHRAVNNFITGICEKINFQPEKVILCLTTISFDIFVLETLLPLTKGLEVVIADEIEQRDGKALNDVIVNHGVTMLQTTPSRMQLLLSNEEDISCLDKLEVIMIGGEAFPQKLLEDLNSLTKARIFNMYGPTETTVWSTVKELTGCTKVDIGKPIANTQIYIVDKYYNPQPIGVPGELCIAGDGLARGYLHRPELTAEKFVDNPFVSGTKMYHTGDLAKWLPNGDIEHLGRLDFQVKIRGYRIEIGEIENLLLKYEKVRDAAVVARVDSNGVSYLSAYVVSDAELKSADLREHLLKELPDYMVPSYFVQIEEMPLTPNGKIDRKALPEPKETAQATSEYLPPQNEIEKQIAQIWCEVLGLEKVGIGDRFFEIGGHSLLLVKVHNKLKKILNIKLSIIDMFKYPTIKALAERISQGEAGGQSIDKGASIKKKKAQHSDIAIVGMAGRFPGAKNISAFWENLCNGVESVKFFTDEELLAAGVSQELLNAPNYVKAGAVLDNYDKFDAAFFGYSPREAEAMDPQHRFFLECAWEVLENAGYNPDTYEGRVALYAGVGINHYLLNLFGDRDLMESIGSYQAFIGNDKDFVPTRVSYKLNLKGPSMAVQTACSSSLVAVHMACQSLFSGESDMVLAGGVSIRTPQVEGYLYNKGGIPSPDGHCRAFDEKAQGTVFGNGVGVVALKRLDDAIADGDHIYAVIKGSSINNDGFAKVGFTAPSIDGQAEVIRDALTKANVEPNTVTYIESHGTGTEMGDPIEIAALKEAYRDCKEKNSCTIGAVKTNIGHLDTAAGVAGLIKTVMALESKVIPPTLNFETPNPKLGLEESPFCVSNTLKEWKVADMPRRAGISSFGIGGTNAHVILEEAPKIDSDISTRPWQLLTLSAKTNTALDVRTSDLVKHFAQQPEMKLADAAYTLAVGRRNMSYKRMLVCRDAADAIEGLQDNGRVFTDYAEAGEKQIAFMFSGQGSQYVNMGLELYRSEQVFKDAVDACCGILKEHLGFDLRELLYPENADEAAAEALQQTVNTQPALFVIEYALAKLWMAWGISPQAMIGHSVGEYVAACLAGVFSLADALALVAARARLMQSLPAGSMLAVSLPEEEVMAYLEAELSLATVNAPKLCVVSGTNEAIDKLENRLTANGVTTRRLHTSHAFHSHMMEPILPSFTEVLQKVKFSKPSIPFLSNVTGTWITDMQATDPNYWVMHLRGTVRFGDGVKELLREEERILLEVGPGQTLSTLARQQLDGAGKQVVLTSMRHPQDKQADTAFILNALGRLWLAGVSIDWQGFYAAEKRRRVPLPTYPFEGKRYWIDAAKQDSKAKKKAGGKKEIAEWFYLPSYRKTMLPVVNNTWGEKKNWLVFADSVGVAEAITNALEAKGQNILTVTPGEGFAKVGPGMCSINPASVDDYAALLGELKEAEQMPQGILHLWSITGGEAAANDNIMNLGFYSLMHLAQAIGKQSITEELQIEVITNSTQKVESRDAIIPEKAMLTAVCKVMPQEYPNITCRTIDAAISADAEDLEMLAECLVDEIAVKVEDMIVCYRDAERWVQTYEQVRVDASDNASMRLRNGGVYLITGGLGGIGLALAEYLAETVQPKLALLGRSKFPERKDWDNWLENHSKDDAISLKLKNLLALEEKGAQVAVFSADVANEAEVFDTIEKVTALYGEINGVIHAAGLPGQGIMQLKNRETVEKVLAPKVAGTRILNAALKDKGLDFFVMCSSINAVIGGFGQVDYAAANAYLDAFALREAAANKRKKSGTYYASINWDRWYETGMTASNKAAASHASGSKMEHPLLDACIVETLDRDVYLTDFTVDAHWVLNEHTIAGIPTIPGTTYLEIARAAFAKHLGENETVELSDVAFLMPFAVSPGEHREAYTVLKKEADGYDFRVISKTNSKQSESEAFVEHVRGKLKSVRKDESRQYDLGELTNRCNVREIAVAERYNGEKKMVTHGGGVVGMGPRWQNLQKVYVGNNEALTVLELPADFAADYAEIKMHPAVMDVATGAIQRIIGDGDYLPLAYEKLTVKGEIKGLVYGYMQYNSASTSDKETVTCNISMLDASGVEVVQIKGFTMKRVNAQLALNLSSQGQADASDAGDDAETTKLVAATADVSAGSVFNRLMESANWTQEGLIAASEGVEAFKRVLAGVTSPQIVVTKRDIDMVIQEAKEFNQAKILAEMSSFETNKTVHARPNVKNAYAAPGSELEQKIAEIWQNVLGIDQVGSNDNFFELGGTSLTGIQVVAELKRLLNVDIPTVSIFEAPTVGMLAKLLNPEKEKQSFNHARDRADKKKEALERQRKTMRERRR